LAYFKVLSIKLREIPLRVTNGSGLQLHDSLGRKSQKQFMYFFFAVLFACNSD